MIRKVVTAVLRLGGSGTCSPPLVTAHYVKAGYGSHQGCVRAQTHGSAADALDFKQVRVNGTNATVEVIPTGGPYDGERLTVSLVDDRHWAVDELHANVPVGP